MGKERLSLAVIISLLIIALFSDLSWIHIMSHEVEHGNLMVTAKVLISPAGFILLFPAIPIIYGWITKNEIGAILAGVLPIIGVFILLNFYLSPPNLERIVVVIAYGGRLSIIAGSAGYFASKRIIPVAILLPILLGVPWFFIFCTGIH